MTSLCPSSQHRADTAKKSHLLSKRKMKKKDNTAKSVMISPEQGQKAAEGESWWSKGVQEVGKRGSEQRLMVWAVHVETGGG